MRRWWCRPSFGFRPSCCSHPSCCSRPLRSSRPSCCSRPSRSSRPSCCSRPCCCYRPSRSSHPSCCSRPCCCSRLNCCSRPCCCRRLWSSSRRNRYRRRNRFLRPIPRCRQQEWAGSWSCQATAVQGSRFPLWPRLRHETFGRNLVCRSWFPLLPPGGLRRTLANSWQSVQQLHQEDDKSIDHLSQILRPKRQSCAGRQIFEMALAKI